MTADLEPWEIPMVHLSEGLCAICGFRLRPVPARDPYDCAGVCERCEARFQWNPTYESQESA